MRAHFTIQAPLERCLLKLEVKKKKLASVLTSSFAIGVILFTPIKFLLFPVGLADAFIPLSIIFGMYA